MLNRIKQSGLGWCIDPMVGDCVGLTVLLQKSLQRAWRNARSYANMFPFTSIELLSVGFRAESIPQPVTDMALAAW